MAHVNFAQNLLEKTSADALAIVPRHKCRSSIRMLEENMRTFLPNFRESHLSESAHHFSRPQNREFCHSLGSVHIIDAHMNLQTSLACQNMKI